MQRGEQLKKDCSQGHKVLPLNLVGNNGTWVVSQIFHTCIPSSSRVALWEEFLHYKYKSLSNL